MKGNQKNIIFGAHPVLEAMEAGRSIEKVFIRQGSTHERVRDIRAIAKTHGVPVQMVPEAKIQRLVKEGNHQGVVAFVSPITYQPLEEVIIRITETGDTPLLVMLDGVTDVRNLGAIARTAECMGAHALVTPAKGSAAVNAAAVKASAGALNHLPICRETNLTDSLMLMQAYGIKTIGCTEKGSETIFEQDFTGPVCLIFGSEERGISSQLLKRSDHLAQIPMTGKVASLNVSVAVGMTMVEAVRQRGN